MAIENQKLNLKAQNQDSKSKIDLKQRSYRFALSVLQLIDLLPKNMSCGIMAKQLLRCSTSIGANIAEARASSSRKDFTNFMTYSLKSANETIFWLGLLIDSGKTTDVNISKILNEAQELSRILGASVLTLRNKRS